MYNSRQIEADETSEFLRRIGMSEQDVKMGVKANEEELSRREEHEEYKRKVKKAAEKLKRYNRNIQLNNEAFQDFMTEFNHLSVTHKHVKENINRLDDLLKDIERMGI